MNLIKYFKENYLTIEYRYNQNNNSYVSVVNRELENDVFNALCQKISDPIRKYFQFDLGSVYFINDLESDAIMFKFSEMNLLFDTSQSLDYIVNEINKTNATMTVH